MIDDSCRQAVIDSIDVMVGLLESGDARYTTAHVIRDLKALQHAVETDPDDGVYQLSTALRRHPVAVCIMNGEDVLTEFGLAEIDDETEEQHKARLAKADDWLADNRGKIEDAMSRAGFEAIGIVGDGPAEFKIGPMPESPA